MHDITPAMLPGVLAQIARVAGVPVAIKVAREWGGRRWHIPRDPHPTHPLSMLVGRPAAQLIGRELGGERLAVPSARTLLRFHDANALRVAGASISEIAAALHLSEAHVCRLIQGTPMPSRHPRQAASPSSGRPRGNPGQLNLF